MIDHACDYSGINLVNTKEEVYFTCIHSTNETHNISMNYDDPHKYYAQFLLSNIHEDVSTET